MAGVKDAGQVRLDHFRPLFRRHFGHVGEESDTGVVDENIETAEARNGRRNRLLDLGVASRVGAQRFDRTRPGPFEQRPRGREPLRVSAGDSDLHTFRHERARDRQADPARASGDDGDLPAERLLAHASDYNSSQMRDVAIVGAGELGGALAHVLARRDVVTTIRLIDDRGSAAAGQALDIMQASPIEGFATEVAGSSDLMTAAGAAIIVLADRAGSGEWQGEEGLAVLRRLSRIGARSIIMCAGAAHREIVERGVRELRFVRARLFGSAPEALAGAVRAIVALEAGRSPADVALTVLGVPPSQIVVPWEDATISGLAATRVLDEPARRRISSRIAPLWPPGVYALAWAAAKAAESAVGGSRRTLAAFVAPDDSGGKRSRTVALSVRLDEDGIVEVVTPVLGAHDRVALDNAMML